MSRAERSDRGRWPSVEPRPGLLIEQMRRRNLGRHRQYLSRFRRHALTEHSDDLLLAKLGERFKPEAVYGKASRRGAYIVVDLKSPADVSELMFALTWGTGGEPKFTPILTESFDEIIGRAKSLVPPKG